MTFQRSRPYPCTRKTKFQKFCVVAAGLFSCVLIPLSAVPAQILDRIHLFPDTTFVSPFSADAHAHRMLIENILFTKNERASMGGSFPIFNIDMFGTTAQANLAASVHFELHPMGQAHVISNDYYVDYLLLDIPVHQYNFVRFAAGHTSHHLSDNWYERLHYTSAVRYSRDYFKLLYIYEQTVNDQFYLGVDYGYFVTIVQRIHAPWTFQSGGKKAIAKLADRIVLFAAFDCKIRQEAAFAATTTIQFGCAIPMQGQRILRLELQHRFGLDERGQFFPQHRVINTIGLSFEM